jgi:broad specificity phosphatase PhoE
MLYFIRHGETDWNAAGRLQGQMDIPLNDKGRVQAAESAAILASLTNVADLDYWASPLTRTRETMERVREALGLHPPFYKTDDRLKELTFGDWEGFTLAEAKANNPDAYQKRHNDKWNAHPPKGESYQDVANRVTPWLNSLTRDTIIVSHGGVGRALLHVLAGVPKHEAAETHIAQGVVYQMEAGGFKLYAASK